MGWLRTLAVRTCLDRIKLVSFQDHFQTLQEDTEFLSFPVDEIFAVKDILSLLNQLPRKQSVIFNLFIVEGYSHDEIGHMLGISAGNARWYLSDAKKRLRTIIIQKGQQIK